MDKKEDYMEIDPMVRPVVKILHDKGFKTYTSCQGHSATLKVKIKNNSKIRYKKFISPPHLTYESTPALDRALKRAGFKISKGPVILNFKKKPKMKSVSIKPRKTRKGETTRTTLKQRQRLWKRTAKEVSRLRIIT